MTQHSTPAQVAIASPGVTEQTIYRWDTLLTIHGPSYRAARLGSSMPLTHYQQWCLKQLKHGKQRFKCHDCGRQFIEQPSKKVMDQATCELTVCFWKV